MYTVETEWASLTLILLRSNQPSNLPKGFQRFGFEKIFRALPGWGFLRFGVRVLMQEFTRSPEVVVQF